MPRPKKNKDVEEVKPETVVEDVATESSPVVEAEVPVEEPKIAPHHHDVGRETKVTKVYRGKPVIRIETKIVNGRLYHEVHIEGEIALLNDADFNQEVI